MKYKAMVLTAWSLCGATLKGHHEGTLLQLGTSPDMIPGVVAKSVEHSSPVQEVVGSKSWSSQIKDL